MKILYLPGYRYPQSLDEPITSGDLRYSFTLSRALSELGHQVTVVSRQSESDLAVSKLGNVRIFRYKGELSKIFTTSFDISYKRLRLFKKLLPDVDLIICNSPLTLEHLLKIKAPIIYVASGLEDVKNYSFSPREIVGYLAIKLLREPLKRRTWRKSILVNTTAKHERKTLSKWGVPKQKIGTISSGVDTSRYYPQKKQGLQIRNNLGIKKTERVILSVSRFTPSKGVVETIEAFTRLSIENCVLLIIGVQHSHDTNYYSYVLKAINDSSKKQKIKLIEDVPERDLPAYYSASDVTSVFSRGYDPLPTVIIESMACGTPVISTYFKTREQFIVNGRTGLFIDELDLRDWGDKVKQLINDKKMRKEISDQARDYVASVFDYKKIAKSYLNKL